MSNIIGELVSAPNLQEQLNTQFVNFDPAHTQDAIGVLQFVKSPLNTDMAMQRQIDGGNGKTRRVEVIYDQRLNEDFVENNSTQSCVGGDEFGDCSKEYEIDPEEGINIKWSVTNSTLIKRLRGNQNWIAHLFQKAMDQADRSIDKQIIQDVALNFGNFSTTSYDHSAGATSAWAGASGPAEVATRKGGYRSGDYNPRFITQVSSEFKNMNTPGRPVVLGDNEIDAFFTESQAACCADSGENLAEVLRLKPIGYMRDEYVESVLGDNHFIGMAPGAVQLLEFLEFRGELNVFNDDTYSQGTLMNVNSGNEYDFIAKFDCGKWNFQIKKAFKPAYLPVDIASASDKLSGVNWVNDFEVVNPDFCDPCAA